MSLPGDRLQHLTRARRLCDPFGSQHVERREALEHRGMEINDRATFLRMAGLLEGGVVLVALLLAA